MTVQHGPAGAVAAWTGATETPSTAPQRHTGTAPHQHTGQHHSTSAHQHTSTPTAPQHRSTTAPALTEHQPPAAVAQPPGPLCPQGPASGYCALMSTNGHAAMAPRPRPTTQHHDTRCPDKPTWLVINGAFLNKPRLGRRLPEKTSGHVALRPLNHKNK